MILNKIPGGDELLNPQKILKDNLNITAGSKIGDCGCGGIGYFTFQAAQIVGETGQVYSIDILKTALKNVEHRAKMLGLKNIKTIWSNLEVYGGARINDSTLDFAFLINILFQSQYPEKILRETARMLRSSGQLLVIEWRPGRFPIGPSPEKKITKEKIADRALGSGLKKVKEFEAGRFHYGIILQKI
ncbi:hypothetical protein COV56_03325 [Candidatus Kuenenbacteria bacterium CG11_big_fil_rev_8_21_14_0_20_37_9]|uniref:Methyltransferase domain-containing protein n=2 Tax=Candidatus Kueneniibacteriota TaxID=1752740 RepID=A0A2M6XSA5_9BACT|nr:MAG: hypothetical protein AUJ29_03100 [Candidatus Kuenenbacteria bacterium CG1_02_38_13]PIR05330.1 MAG: hypothetical protein COV56_03325 [Candidatus Kuenenbacteria bacterium CG11_big_fil_rev_8_21_14_0_20_37_9]PIU10524.1 MAG: hypothetical protein COT27_02610 [Candidatus Kuenenbacteria bacterium CG08_land_8_20_14_0_20_37_23]